MAQRPSRQIAAATSRIVLHALRDRVSRVTVQLGGPPQIAAVGLNEQGQTVSIPVRRRCRRRDHIHAGGVANDALRGLPQQGQDAHLQ